MKSESETLRTDDKAVMIISHEHPDYQFRWKHSAENRWNGAFYYSREIVDNIIPKVTTERNWVTINIPERGCSNSIVFIHNNQNPELYKHLLRYTNMVLVCGIPETVPKMEWLGKSIYLPLSIDIEDVRQYRTRKTKGTAFVGRPNKREHYRFPRGTDFLEGMPRPLLLERLAEYRRAFAVGRCALECLALDVEVLPYDERFPDPSRWQLLDNSEAAEILQKKLDIIDG